MRQPSVDGSSANASTPPLEPEICECVLEFVVPTPLALPCHAMSKLAPPEPTVCTGSPAPVPPCSVLPHSLQPFQIASSAPTKPGQLASGVVLSLAESALKLSNTSTVRWGRPSTSPLVENPWPL